MLNQNDDKELIAKCGHCHQMISVVQGWPGGTYFRWHLDGEKVCQNSQGVVRKNAP